MNIFKGTLDTRQQNGVIASINQFDNATLELKIVTDGQIDNVWDEPRFELIGMKRDNNPVREVDQDHFTILSKEEHKVRIELKEQFLTCRGIVKMQLIIKDGGRESTTIFYLLVGQSLDRDIIESRVDVKVLDDLETYIQTGREVIYDAQAIVTDLKDEMSEFNASSSEKEAERQASELNRASKELNRIDNEETRVTNEHDRVTNEEDRVTNEEERVANEQDRVTNEQNRRLAENTRIAQERARQDAELQRNSIFEENETIRKDGEKKRITNENEREKKFSTWEERETTRLRSEENRIIQEQVRVANEETRQRHEQTRQNQEDYRQRTYTQFNEAEASRVNKELQRQTAEENRVAAEANRQNSYADRENERDRQYAESEKTRNDAFEQNEVNRQSEYTTAERQRVESEELRKSRERERETAESQRATTERERVNAEQKRAADFNREIENIQNTMNQAVSNVNGAIDTANSTMEGIEQRAEECLPVIEQSSNEIERARVDYIGNQHSSIKKANDANVDWLLGEVNTAHYEGQHITALDTLEGQAKSSILKGNTMVNLIDFSNFVNTSSTIKNGDTITVTSTNDNGWANVTMQLNGISHGKTYIACWNSLTYTYSGGLNKLIGIYAFDNNNNQITVKTITEDQTNNYLIFTFPSEAELTKSIYLRVHATTHTGEQGATTTVKGLKVIEYQDGMENWDIPYFEGMQSVKMPVLTTIGKNLFDGQLESGRYAQSEGVPFADNTAVRTVNKIKVKPLTVYTLKTNDGTQLYNTSEYCNGVYIGHKFGTNTVTFTTSPTTNELHLSFRTSNIQLQFQLEEGSQATSYEPFKTNILSASEDVTLRGIGDVQDELDCLTGEVTERVGEIVLDGSENWVKKIEKESTVLFQTSTDVIEGKTKKCLSNAFSFNNSVWSPSDDTEGVALGGSRFTRIDISIAKTKLTTLDGNGFKTYLQNNPITIQYALATESIKTVDLSDNHVYSYKDVTHYDCSSAEGSLVPTLSIDVPTNLPAVVTRQRVTIQELEKENVALKNVIEETANSSVNGDLELMSSQFELDFRLFEIEMNLDMPMMAMMRGVKSMAMTVYQQAKTLILAGKYEREDMEYKLNRYKAAGRIAVEEYEELIALMDARELVD